MKATTVGDNLANVEIGVRAKKGNQEALAAFILEIINEGGVLKAQEIHYSDRFIIVAPDGSGGQGVFTFDQNGAKLAVANIGTVRAAYMEGYNNKMMIDLNNGRLRVRST